MPYCFHVKSNFVSCSLRFSRQIAVSPPESGLRKTSRPLGGGEAEMIPGRGPPGNPVAPADHWSMAITARFVRMAFVAGVILRRSLPASSGAASIPQTEMRPFLIFGQPAIAHFQAYRGHSNDRGCSIFLQPILEVQVARAHCRCGQQYRRARYNSIYPKYPRSSATGWPTSPSP